MKSMSIKEKLKRLVAAFFLMIVKAIDILEIIAKQIRQYLRDNEHFQDFLRTWKHFWKYKKQYPNEWQNSAQDKALRTILGIIVRVIYVCVFVWGMIMIEQKRECQSNSAKILNSTVPSHLRPRRILEHVTVDGKTYEFEKIERSTPVTSRDTRTSSSSATSPTKNMDSIALPIAPSIRKTLEEEEIKGTMSDHLKTLPEANVPVIPNTPASQQYVERTGGPVIPLGSRH